MTNNTNQIFAALSAAFVAELADAYTGYFGVGYFGDEYADSYFRDAVDEAAGYAGNLEADFLPFLCDAADAYGDRFNKWVDAKVPVYTDKLAAVWVELGYPEPDSDCGGDIPARMGRAVYDVIAEQARDAADKLAELAADFAERYSAAEERAQAEADELEAAEELEELGVRSNYAGMYSISREEGGCIVQLVFDSAVSALAAYHESNA